MTLNELLTLIRPGENDRLEFKKTTGQLRSGMKTVCAFGPPKLPPKLRNCSGSVWSPSLGRNYSRGSRYRTVNIFVKVFYVPPWLMV
jgi:hypothetical protein